ncbi:hypothetical protein MXB_1192 [Myxobolus squamalis]|nr:hypothetical protein MXB_1192 [Myxobolus squamalis]
MYVDTDGKLGTKESSQPQINSSKHIVPKIVIQPCEPEFETKPASQLAELFNKTACEPHIYWLSQSNDDPPAEECEITPLVSYDQKIESKCDFWV